MTTLNDINVLRLSAEVAERKYNRRCRRLVDLYRAGRTPDHVTLYNTDILRMGFESTTRDLYDVIAQQAMVASMEAV